jgi:trehalose synthase
MGKLLEKYRGLVPQGTLETLAKLSARCAGRSVLHVYSGRLRWDVLNMLDRLSKLFEDLGLNFRAATMVGTEEFCDLVALSEESGLDSAAPASEGWSIFYDAAIRASAERMFLSSDMVVVHGLQPIGLVRHRLDDRPWVWRCHSNVREAQPAFWSLASAFAGMYQGAAFSHPSFAPDATLRPFVIPPSVDPFCPSNRDLPSSEIAAVLEDCGVPPGRPLALYFLSRGSVKEALDAVRLWKAAGVSEEAVLVLVHVGEQKSHAEFLSAVDRDVLRSVDRNVHFVRLDRGSAREIGALEWAARVVVDPAASLWPNLALLDAMWKGKPVIVHRAAASAALVREGAGVCVGSIEELARRLREFLDDPAAARTAGAASRRWVTQRHLTTRHLEDYMRLLLQLQAGHGRA